MGFISACHWDYSLVYCGFHAKTLRLVDFSSSYCRFAMPGFWILLVGCDVLGVQRFPELTSQS